jgi:integrase
MGRHQNGTLRKKSGAYIGQYSTWTYHSDGPVHTKKRHQHSVKLGAIEDMSVSTAKLELQKIIRKNLEKGPSYGETVASLDWFVKKHWLPVASTQWKPNTAVTNKHVLKLITDRFGTDPLARIGRTDLIVWLNSLNLNYSASVVRRVKTFMKSICEQAIYEGIITKNPTWKLPIDVNAKPVIRVTLNLEEIKRVIDFADGVDKTLIKLLFVTGLRPSELFAIRWRDISFEDSSIRVVNSIYRGKLRIYTKTTNPKDAQSNPGRYRELTTSFLPKEMVDELSALFPQC